MTTQVDSTLRGPEAYATARQVLAEMEAAAVWPTPLNFELWLHSLIQPDGPLATELRRLLTSGDPFSDAMADSLAAEFLPRGRMSEEIRDAGRVLDRELSSVSEAISRAHQSNLDYGRMLQSAASQIAGADDAPQLQGIVAGLTRATRRVQTENETLEKKLAVSTSEVARLREHLEQVRRDAMTDALTNLANRKAFDDYLTTACDQAETQCERLSLAVLDIDHFKRFNDTWGHQTGDQVLRYVASVLGRAGAPPRIAARYGGEEFALIFPRESQIQVETVLENVRQEIASRQLRRRSTNDDLGTVTISAGFAVWRAGETASSLLERADAALYASKHAGRNRVTFSDPTAQAA